MSPGPALRAPDPITVRPTLCTRPQGASAGGEVAPPYRTQPRMLISGCRGMVLGRSAMWGAGAISGASQIAPLSSPAGAGPTHAQTRTPRGAPARPGRLAALLPRRSSFIPMSSASAGSSFPLLPAPASALTPAPAPALCGPGLPQEPPPFGAPPCRPRRAGSLPRPAASASAAASPSPPPPKPAAQGTRLSDALWPGLGEGARGRPGPDRPWCACQELAAVYAPDPPSRRLIAQGKPLDAGHRATAGLPTGA